MSFYQGLVRKYINKNISRGSVLSSVHPDLFSFAGYTSVAFIACGYLNSRDERKSNGYWNWNWSKVPYKVKSNINEYVPKFLQPSCHRVAESFYSYSSSERYTLGLIGLQACVWGLFRFGSPKIQRFLSIHFMDLANNKRPYTMITANFSHISFPHLAANMFALYSFAPPVIDKIGPYHFTAFYISGGAASSLVSRLAKRYKREVNIPSIGASGAIFSVFSLYAGLDPSAQLTFPMATEINFTPWTALLGSMAVDTACILMRFSTIDHFAHLGGSCFGIMYNYCDGNTIYPFFKEIGKEINRII